MSWGINTAGQLGDGSTGSPSDVPVEVLGLSKMAGVSAGGRTCSPTANRSRASAVSARTIGPTAGGTKRDDQRRQPHRRDRCQFGASAATESKSISSTSITAVSPPGSGIVDVTVTIEAGTSPKTTADQFTYQAPPTITKLSVKSGPVSGTTSVTITGTGFTARRRCLLRRRPPRRIHGHLADDDNGIAPAARPGRSTSGSATRPGRARSPPRTATSTSRPSTGLSPSRARRRVARA